MDPDVEILLQRGRKSTLAAILMAVVLVIAFCSVFAKMNDLRKQRDLIEGKLGEKDRALMEADAAIGRLDSDLTTEKELRQKAEEVLNANHEEWEKERKKYGWRIETLTRANADLALKIDQLVGEGGPFVNENAASSSDALTYVQDYLNRRDARLGWQYDNGRVGVRTTDVFAQPPVADVWTDQHFRVDSMVVRTRTGVKQGYVRLSEVDDQGKVISEAQSVTGDFSWTAEQPKWHDHVLLGARAGVEANREARLRFPVYGQIGYQSLGVIPLAVTADPYVSVDGQNTNGLRFDYGAGLYLHVRKP